MVRSIPGRRFEILYKQKTGTASTARIFVGMETGVPYLQAVAGYAGGLTPLLDRKGKPLLAPFARTKPEKF